MNKPPIHVTDISEGTNLEVSGNLTIQAPNINMTASAVPGMGTTQSLDLSIGSEGPFVFNDDQVANAGRGLRFDGAIMSQPHAVTPYAESDVALIRAYYDTCEINAAAGNHANAGWDAADHQMKIIESEFKELRDLGVRDRNIKELRDGMGDLLFTVVGMAHRLDIDLIADFAEVVRSNLTKFDYTEEDALLTKGKYAKIGIDVVQTTTQLEDGRTRWVTFSARDQVDAQGKDYLGGKWLKSHNYQDVELSPLSDDNRLLELAGTLAPEPTPAGQAIVRTMNIQGRAPANLETSEASQEAAETLYVAAPLETLTQLLKTHSRFHSRFQHLVARHIKAYLADALQRGDSVWKAHDSEEASVSDLPIQHSPVPDAVAEASARHFLSLLLHPDNDGPTPSDKDVDSWVQELEPVAGLNDVKGNDSYFEAVYALTKPADRVAFQRSFEALGRSLLADPETAIAFHSVLVGPLQDQGVSWTTAQLVADLVLWRFFGVDSLHAFLEAQQPSEETRELLIGKRDAARQVFATP
jgi:hypothetical protein